ncbi:MAG: alpha/beta hydrolase family protein [Planctomycetaceae bacterium]
MPHLRLISLLFPFALAVFSADVLAGETKTPAIPGARSTWNGYDRYDFEVDGKPVLVVAPQKPAAGLPWIWRGEFFGHRPEPDIALLGRGFHVVYMGIPDMFGAPQAVAHWDALHKYLTEELGFANKPALIGVSRGGLYCYNWAAANPDKVACIYGDAPVCDIKSWPMGKGTGTGNSGEIPKLLKVYGVATEEELLNVAVNPIDHLEPLAKAKIPLLHVYGDADTGVPWDENTGVIAERYNKLGGEITLIAKPGVGHVHGLDDATPLVEFMAKHTLAAIAAESAPKATSKSTPDTDALVYFSFDDHSIPWHHNVKLTLVEATKHPENPVVRKGPKGTPDHGHAILYGTVLHDGKKFRMWYLGMFETELARGQAPGWWRPMLYAESDDGIRWMKPDLGLVEFNGNTQNNICLIESEPHSLSRVNDFLSVIHEPHDPDPAKRYKATFIAHVPFADVKGGRSKIGPDESRWGAFICATSADGLSWKVVGDHPMNAGGERFEVSSLYKFGDFYYAAGQLISPWMWRIDGRDVGRATRLYRSSDFENWSRATAFAFARPAMLVDKPTEGQQGHMGFGLWNRGNVLVGLHGLWQDGPNAMGTARGATIDLGLGLSNDGIHFREPVPDFKVIPRGKPGEWDDVALLQGHAFVNVGDETYIWYSHWNTIEELKGMEIGLATLRRDGFGYLSRMLDDQHGLIVTTNIPAEKSGYTLSLNVENVSEALPLKVELLDKLGRPLPQYAGDNAAVVTTSGVIVEVEFPGAATPTPVDKEFGVQIHFPASGDARLYAVYLKKR